MKRFLFIVVVLCAFLSVASADRYVDADECADIDEFYKAIEMGTTVTVNGYVISDHPYKDERDSVEGYCFAMYIDISGCARRQVYIFANQEQAQNLVKDDYVSISGQMFSRGNTGKAYYFNTQIENGYVEKLDVPEPTILDLNEELFDMVSKIKEHHIGDIVKGEGIKVVSTDEWTNTSSKETTYYYYFSVGNLRIRFYNHAKDIFKGDIVDFECVIYDYDEENKTLLCDNPVYHVHGIN